MKIGYSKSDRRTYEHRSPREVLDRLAVVAADLGRDGRKFTTDGLRPPVETRLGDVPSYQVYLCLGFLLRSGLVRRHGRQGYTVDAPGRLPAAVRAAWDGLGGR